MGKYAGQKDALQCQTNFSERLLPTVYDLMRALIATERRANFICSFGERKLAHILVVAA
jgi:hypothetical protein